MREYSLYAKALTVVILLNTRWGAAQNDCSLTRYKSLMLEAHNAAFGISPDYQLAIDKLVSARTCQRDSETVVNAELIRVFKEVNRQRELAVQNAKEARLQQIRSKALYLASEAWNIRHNDPTQALNLLQEAYKLSPSHPSVLEKIVPTFYEGNKKGFYKMSFENDFFANGAYFSKKEDLIMSFTYYGIKVWGIDGRLKKSIKPKDKLIENAYFMMQDSVIFYRSDSTLLWCGVWTEWEKIVINHGGVKNMDVSLQNEILVTSETGNVTLYDQYGNNPQFIHMPKKAKDAIFSHDGAKIVVRSKKTAYILNKKGTLLDSFVITSPYFDIGHIALSRNNTVLSVCSGDTAYVYNTKTKKITKLPHSNDVRRSVFTPDSSLLLTIYDSSIAHMEMQNAILWNLDGQMIDTLHHTKTIYGISFSPDGTEILTTSSDSTAKLWDMQGDLIRVFRHNGGISTGCFSKDGNHILTASDDYTVKYWNKNPYNTTILKPFSRIEKALFLHDSNRLISISNIDNRDTVSIWANDGSLLENLTSNSPFTDISASNKSNLFIASTQNGKIYIKDIDKPARNKELNVEDSISQVLLSKNDRFFLVMLKQKVLVYELKSRKFVKELPHDQFVQKAKFSENECYILTLSGRNTVQLWDIRLPSNKPVKSFPHAEVVYDFAFSPDGNQIVTATLDKKVILWQLTGKKIKSFPHLGGVSAVLFSPDGKRILSIVDDYTIRLWNKSNAKAPINTMTFSGNFREIVYRDSDSMIAAAWGQVYLSDLTYGPVGGIALFDQELNLVAKYDHADGVQSTVFSNDGNKIVSTSWNGKSYIWLTPQGIFDWAKTNLAPLSGRLKTKYEIR